MAGIKNKIKDMMHKDKAESPTHGTTTGHHSTAGMGTGTTGHHSTTGATTGTTGHRSTTGTHGHESAGTKAKEALGGYDATTSTGGRSGYSEEGARTGMSDLDINRSSNTGGGTTGLREGHHGTGQTTSAGGVGGSSLGTTRMTDSTTGEIIDAERFTKTEDHEVVIEKKAYELEHRPVQKKYVVETKFEGERAVGGGPTELLGTEAREVEERVVEMPHGDREVVVENVDIPVEGVLPGHKINLPASEGVFPAGSRSDKVEALAGQHGHHHHDTHGTGMGSGTGTGMGSGTGTGMGGNTGMGSGTGTGMGGNTGMGSSSRGNEGLGMTGGQGTGTNPGTGLSGSNTGSGQGTSGRGTGL